jgi:uncharacterized protein YqhQ
LFTFGEEKKEKEKAEKAKQIATVLRYVQGDQIGRLFALSIFWKLQNYLACLQLWLSIIFAKKCMYVLGYILGDFFTNSSGHTFLRIIMRMYFCMQDNQNGQK